MKRIIIVTLMIVGFLTIKANDIKKRIEKSIVITHKLEKITILDAIQYLHKLTKKEKKNINFIYYDPQFSSYTSIPRNIHLKAGRITIKKAIILISSQANLKCKVAPYGIEISTLDGFKELDQLKKQLQTGNKTLFTQLDKLMYDKIEFKENNISQVIKFLSQNAQQQTPPIKITSKLQHQRYNKITICVENIPASHIIPYICWQTGLTFQIKRDVVIKDKTNLLENDVTEKLIKKEKLIKQWKSSYTAAMKSYNKFLPKYKKKKKTFLHCLKKKDSLEYNIKKAAYLNAQAALDRDKKRVETAKKELLKLGVK